MVKRLVLNGVLLNIYANDHRDAHRLARMSKLRRRGVRRQELGRMTRGTLPRWTLKYGVYGERYAEYKRSLRVDAYERERRERLKREGKRK